MRTVLVVDDERNLLEVLSVALEDMGYEAVTAESAERGLELLAQRKVHLVLSDLRLPGLAGREFLAKVKSINPAMPVIIMTAYASVKDAVELIKEGAFDYIAKPFDLQALEAAVAGAVRFFDLENENRALRRALGGEFSRSSLVGKGPAMEAVRRSIAEVSASNSNVIIMGESGTGKELIARAIHCASPRAAAPLVTVNCAAIPEALLESELFGHVKGAFTGALCNHPGRFAQADGGSLFLDEIGDMPLFLQAKMLRAIQEKTIDPVGATQAKQVDVRIIAATNRDLAVAVEEGAFRQDLYYRLHVYPVVMPPLRERKEDIPLLAEHFAARIAGKMGRQRPLRFSPQAMRALQNYPWPGNVRELENCIERLTIVNTDGVVNEDALASLASGRQRSVFSAVPVSDGSSPAAGGTCGADKTPQTGFPLDLQQTLQEFERTLLLSALEQSGGVQVKAAELLGISERSIWHKVKKLGIRIKKNAV